jgi:hypothetical protein
VLAVARLLAWLFERNKVGFACAWVAIAAFIVLGKRLHVPDNLYEWRNWPAATLFMVIGMKFPKDWRVPFWLGLGGAGLALVLTWFNMPGMWKAAPCLTCNIDYVTSPEIGSYGFLPVFVAEQLLIFLFFLWAGQNPPALLGKVGRYFGRASLQFLLLHGWLIVSIIPAITNFFPPHESIALILAILLLNPPVHALIFKYTEHPLNWVLARCFDYGRATTDWGYKLAGLGTAGQRALRRPATGG